MKPGNTIRSLRFRYIIGLSVIAILVTASFFTMQRVVSEQRNFSTLVNLAGHQAGLVNRINYFAGLMATTSDESEFKMAKSQVGLTINKIRNGHEILRNGDPKNGIPTVTTDSLRIIYDDPMVGLDQALRNFLEKAETLYATEMHSLNLDSGPYVYLTTYGPHVLEPLLDAAVDEYEQIGKEAILRIERLEASIWVTTLIALLLELLFIFSPLDRHIRNTLNSLQASIKKLMDTRQRLLSAQELALVGDWELRLPSGDLTWSEQVYAICGVAPQSYAVTLKSSLRLVHPEDRDHVRNALTGLDAEGKTVNMEYRIVRPDGRERLVFQHATVRMDHTGRLLVSGTLQDITERRELSVRLERLSEHIPGFIFEYLVDQQGRASMPYASRGIEATCGIQPGQVKDDIGPLTALLLDEDRERLTATIFESTKKLSTWHAQYRICHPAKGNIWLEGHATPEKRGDGSTLWYGYIWDITDRKRSEDRIHKLALYDPLTGLANRRLLKDRLSHAIATSRRNQQYGAVIILDLDNFKSLNDTKGHEVGDALLIEVAKRLHSCVRESDTISRLGGDEFVIVLESLGPEKKSAWDKAAEIAEKLRVALARVYYLCDGMHTHHASASIGATLFLSNHKSESELLKQADVAMYEAKELGRNRISMYSEERQISVNLKSALTHDMQVALEQGDFELFLQPQLSANGRLCGAEALLRWFPPGKEPISPATFIPLAESNGLILPIGEWVLEQACTHLRSLEKIGLPENFALAVNISARQFNDEAFVDKIRAILSRAKVNVKRLKFELTESCLIQDLDRGQAILKTLRELGLKIELDDFGTGYSSLVSINQLPIDALKIDRSLVQGIHGEKSTTPIVRAIIAMAKAMDKEIVAEGVETTAQSRFFINEGCDLLQGYLFARPMPMSDFIVYLENQMQKSSPPRSTLQLHHLPRQAALACSG